MNTSNVAKRIYIQSLCVRNIRYDVTLQDLRQFFALPLKIKKILDIRLLKNKSTGQFTGIAFLDVKHTEAKLIIERYNDCFYRGKFLKVELSRSSKLAEQEIDKSNDSEV